jgi:hypothetical protein
MPRDDRARRWRAEVDASRRRRVGCGSTASERAPVVMNDSVYRKREENADVDRLGGRSRRIPRICFQSHGLFDYVKARRCLAERSVRMHRIRGTKSDFDL